jgi:hypothetical protein
MQKYLLRFYLSKVCHLFTILAVASLLILAYFASHSEKLTQASYWRSIGPIVTNGVRILEFGMTPDGGQVAVLHGGTRLNSPTNLPALTFDAHRSSAVQGLVENYAGHARWMNASLERSGSEFLAAFRPSDSHFSIPMSHFGGNLGRAEIRIARSQFSELKTNTGFLLARSGKALLLHGQVYDPQLKSALVALTPPSPAAVPIGKGSQPEPKAGPITGEVLRQIVGKGTEVAEAAKLGGLRPLRETDERPAIEAYFRGWTETMVKVLAEKAGLRVAHQNTVALLTPPTERTAANELLTVLIQHTLRMHAEMTEIIRAETGPVWLAGRFRWLEIMFWAWFGVFVYELIYLGTHLTNKAPEALWRPGQTLRMGAKLVYAPLLACVLFLGVDYFLSEAQAHEVAKNGKVVLVIAFVIGLFPNTAFRMVSNLVKVWLREDIADGKQRVPQAEPVVVKKDATHLTPGGVYKIANLKNNLTRIVTAPTQ